MRKCYLTIDVDMMTRKNDSLIKCDDFECFFDVIQSFFEKHSEIKANWFIRIDQGIEKDFGQADYVLQIHKNKLQWLKERGHQLGWHYHIKKENVEKTINTEQILKDMELIFPIVKEWKLDKYVRIGGCICTNDIMRFLEEKQIRLDSTAVPRPQYHWLSKAVNWVTTPNHAYYPSVMDYRIPGKEHRKILEVPMNTVPIKGYYDEFDGIKRYINPAYYSEIFKEAVNKISEDFVIITHPFEAFSQSSDNVGKGLVSGDFFEFERNMIYLKNNCKMGTLNDFFIRNERKVKNV